MGYRRYPRDADSDESFVTVLPEIDLTESRVITAGPGVSLTDTGDEIIVSASASAFSSAVKYVVMQSDPSLPNARVLTPGANVNITDGISIVTVAATGLAPDTEPYLTWTTDSLLPNNRIITVGTGISFLNDGTYFTISVDSTVATLTGTQTLTNKTLTSPIINQAVAEVYSDYSVLSGDRYILVNASTGIITITLPSATSVGKEYTVKKIDSSPNDVILTSTSTIDGGTFTLRRRYDAAQIVASGTAWYVV